MNKLLKLSFIIIPLVFLCCDRSQKDRKNLTKKTPTVEKPSQKEIHKLTQKYSIPLGKDIIRVPKSLEKEKCDELDNDGDGFFDEGCFGCCPGAMRGDFDCNGKITSYDCGFPILIVYNKTISNFSIRCADLDGNGKVGWEDAFKCLEILNQEGSNQ